MKYLACSNRARKNIKASVKQKLARYSNFACSICGEIPIVFHHIEEWSKKFSNHEKYIIPICDTCHRRIHGEGGRMYSKEELYEFKAKPDRPSILRDRFPLERKRSYSFFVGSNFVENVEKASLFRIGEHTLLSIDTSSGILKLSVLASIKNNKATYLIKDNELLIDAQDIWQMKYSGNSLKIEKRIDGKSSFFIDLIIKPKVIIVRGMDTTFNDKSFRVYKLRKPQERQIDKIVKMVKECEKYYRKVSVKIDKGPLVGGVFNGIDISQIIKKSQKDRFKIDLERYLMFEFCKEFDWDFHYYQFVLSSVLEKSSIFKKERKFSQFAGIDKTIKKLEKKYQKEFEGLDSVVVKYNNMVLRDNMVLSGCFIS